MKKATDALLNDHKMIRKLLGNWRPDNPRRAEVGKTLERVVGMHAWMEDAVFLPGFRNEPRFTKVYLDELYEEHKHIDLLAKLLSAPPAGTGAEELESYERQFRAILENHLTKEEDALFPLAERFLDVEGMNKLSAEMESRQAEAQKLFNPGA